MPVQGHPLNRGPMPQGRHCLRADGIPDESNDLHRCALDDAKGSYRKNRVPRSNPVNNVEGEGWNLAEAFFPAVAERAVLASGDYKPVA